MSDLTDTGTSSIDDVTGNNRPSFQITVPGAGETPSLYVDGVEVAATLSQNPFIPTIYYLTPIDPIGDGAHSITYTFSDAAGNESIASDPLPITVDATASVSPTVAPNLATSSDSGVIDNDDYTKEDRPEFDAPAGTGTAGDRVRLYIDGVAVATGTVSADGSFTVSPDNSIPDGVHSATYSFLDAAGNESSQSPALSVTIDTAATEAPTIVSVPENSLGGVTPAEQASGGGTLVNIAIPADANAGDELTLVVGTGPTQQRVDQTVLAGEPGTTISVLISEASLTALTAGTYDVVVTITDKAGNISAPSSPFALTLTGAASTAPTISSVPDNANGGVNSVEAVDGVVVNVDLTGVQTSAGVLNSAGGDTVRVTIGGISVDVVLTATDVTNGTIAVTIPNTPAFVALAEGSQTITAVVFDGAPGTNGRGDDDIADPVSAPFNITLDRSVTAATLALDMTSATDTGTLATDNNTRNTTPDFVTSAGSGTPGDTVTLFVDGVLAGTGTVLADGSFVVTPSAPLADDTYDAQYTFTDPVGNVSSLSPILTFTIDTIKPTTPAGAPDMTAATDSGTSNTDDYTGIAQPVFNIAAPGPGESAKFYVDGVAVPFAPIGGNNYPVNESIARRRSCNHLHVDRRCGQ